jgi:hypothetical protein
MLIAMLAVLSLAAEAAAPAAGPGPAPAPAAAPVKTQAALTDTICWVEKPVGSHVPHRYCAPKFYWEQRQRQDREGLHPFGKGGGGGPDSGGLGGGPGGG